MDNLTHGRAPTRHGVLVPPNPRLPVELLSGPFRRADAARVGLDPQLLRGRAWRRLLHSVYCAADLPDTSRLRLAATSLILPPGGALTGAAALWARGLLTPREVADTIDVMVPTSSSLRSRPGVRVNRAVLHDDDIEMLGTIRVAALARAVLDGARRLSLVETTVLIDAVLADGVDGAMSAPLLQCYLDSRAKARGVPAARRALSLASSRAQSPMETRMRLLYVLDGFPQPLVNVAVHSDLVGHVVHPDLLFVQTSLAGIARVFGSEYDGRYHDDPEVLRHDLRRENGLGIVGFPLLRYTARDYYRDPGRILREVRALLRLT